MSNAFDNIKIILAKASLSDQTFVRPDKEVVKEWARILGNVDLDDAFAAVEEHYANETRRLMPADVRAGVRRIRNERLRRDFEDIPALDDVAHDPVAYLSTLRAYRADVGAGNTPPPPPLGTSTTRRNVEKLIKDTDRQMKIRAQERYLEASRHLAAQLREASAAIEPPAEPETDQAQPTAGSPA